VAAVAAVLTMAAPLRLGPMLAICAGIVAGLRAQRSEPGDP
jgi:hypothetical protein